MPAGTPSGGGFLLRRVFCFRLFIFQVVLNSYVGVLPEIYLRTETKRISRGRIIGSHSKAFCIGNIFQHQHFSQDLEVTQHQKGSVTR